MSTPLARRKTTNRTRPAARRQSAPVAAPEQYRELAAMGVIAVGAFLGVQLFLGVGVGPLGGWLESAARLGVGRLVWALPVALIAAGVLLLIDHPIIDAPPARMGAGIGVLTACLASAAGSFGLGGATRERWFDAHTMKALGGFVGETLYFVTAHLMGGIGTGLLVVIGALAAVTLLTGASVATMARRSGTVTARAGATVGRGVSTATVTASGA